ncbi:hypothetical protein GCM10022393_04180 [Aquimarina addita]|uniref:YARHG domain-containing protein n=1 Tax=Aquimarina addita TaxID=870485 RepID=A0ABP7X9G8_9FLAO
MNIRLSLLLFIFHIPFYAIVAQITSADTTSWKVKNKLEYTGTYNFGTSDLVLSYVNGSFEGKIINSKLNDDGNARIEKRETISNIRIEGNTFYSNKSKGDFVVSNSGGKQIFGLKIYEPWNTKKDIEIGQLTSVRKRYIGNYPYTSFRILTKNDLKFIQKSELQIMRNEIYARHGHIFTEGGKMDIHFRKQPWYTAQQSDATDLLTEIEKNNIDLIKQVEQE